MNASMPGNLVSIVIPNYNCADTLIETIDSALIQDCNKEVIVVDDGSTDESREVIESYGSKIIAHYGKNEGVSAARSTGESIASGKYIQYLDADDVLYPGALSLRVQAMERTGADVVYSDWVYLEKRNGEHVVTETVSRSIDDVSTDYELACLKGFWCPPAAIMYTRNIISRIEGWRRDLKVLQDARFLFDVARAGAVFTRVKETGAKYRVRENMSLSRSNDRIFMDEVFQNSEEIHRLWGGDKKIDEARKNALVDSYDYASRNYFLMGSPRYLEALERIHVLKPGEFRRFPEYARRMSGIFGMTISRHMLRAYLGVMSLSHAGKK